MFVVLGASGHVGSAVADALLGFGESVTVVVRDPAKAERLRARGARVATVDIGDADALRAILVTGRRAFLLNPPAPVSGDTDTDERRTASAIVEALNGSGLKAVVAQSTYGAQPGRGKGDLGVLHEFEEALLAQPIPVTILRAAYYMTNWDPMVEAARRGTLPSLFPADFHLPMVAAEDLGRAAARFLREEVGQGGIRYVEGPARYTPGDVAAAFAAALGRPVAVAVTPRDGWVDAYRRLGFSREAASSYAGMTAATLDQGAEVPPDPVRGTITLADHVARVVAATGAAGDED